MVTTGNIEAALKLFQPGLLLRVLVEIYGVWQAFSWNSHAQRSLEQRKKAEICQENPVLAK